MYDPEKHHRRSIRLKGYDYGQVGSYFLTICIENRVHLLGDIKNDMMGLNTFGLIAYEEWGKTASIRKNISLGAFIVMPNHVHGIIHIDSQLKKNEAIGKFQSPSQTIGAIIRGYKGATTKRIKGLLRSAGGLGGLGEFLGAGELEGAGELQFAPTVGEIIQLKAMNLQKSIWQRDYYDIIIKDNSAYENISNYIKNNPNKWWADKFHS